MHYQISNVATDYILCDLVHSANIQFILQLASEKM